MTFPLFYTDTANATGLLMLDEATARHINQVLRMKTGDSIALTNGQGKKFEATIQEQGKRSCTVMINQMVAVQPPQPNVSVAISLVKNAGRFEWFLEKATEIGVNNIIPLLCERTEKSHFRVDRMKNILVSAMLQSQQCWLPQLQEPVKFKDWITTADTHNKWMAHCIDGEKNLLTSSPEDSVICIGPEGDFTSAEISLALSYGFKPATLGDNRLRTETAGMVAATLLRIA